jgi:hypothetical protein
MRKTLLVALAAGLLATGARAAIIDVPLTTTNQTLNFVFNDGGGDTINLVGQDGINPLDTSTTVTGTIFVGSYNTVSTPNSGTRTFDLSYPLTLGGVTHTVTQSAVWTITTGTDTFVASGGGPVSYSTPSGDWTVTPDAFTINNGAKVGTVPFTVSADFSPVPSSPVPSSSVPESATWGLVGTTLVSLLALRRRQGARC